MKYIRKTLGAAQILVALMLSTASLTAGSPAGQSADGAAVKIVSVTATTFTQAKGLPMMTTLWETPSGVRLDFNGDSQANVILVPKGLNAYVLNPSTKQAFLVSGTSAALRQNLAKSPSPLLSHERRLAPIDFLGYRCAVREGTQVLNGSLYHVQIWEARVGNRVETLRYCSQADDGGIMLIEAVSVHVYPQTPPGLLDVPVGYTVTAMDAATAQKGTLPALSARVK